MPGLLEPLTLGMKAILSPCLRLGMTGDKERGILPIPADLIVGKELTIIGSMGMPARAYPEMLRMVETGVIKPSALVTQEVTLEQTGDVLEAMTTFDTLGYSVIVN
ncbi:MAG: alcohol dehydrogenase [Rhodothermales bacterium]